MTTNPAFDALAVFDSLPLPQWPTSEDQRQGDIVVDLQDSALDLKLPGWPYNTLDPTLWPSNLGDLPSLDYATSTSSNTESTSLGTPPSTSSLPISLPSPVSTFDSLPLLPITATSASATSPIFSPEACWAAVLARDRSSDTLFVYSVSSTRIYCRPTCPARRPLRSNVSFYTTPLEAEAAGYRACQRCKPKEEKDPAEKRQGEAVENAKRVIREKCEMGGKVGLKELAEKVGLSAFHLHRQFKARVGVTPEGYAKTVREEMEARKGATRGRLAR
ncbi:metal binding domain of Ada-domain-containing protein [Leucosporidium creatinivorum]|uniref:Metal binding domain of Ada-domain-containing protein n=1 Tax=Leucosporidium creatinivorum TaxID=106004 RepID=A0A1Y2F158_9BASI|nr:metal binding domain of Ada-domain-containing protein [Leucosporidium creatinivorum]